MVPRSVAPCWQQACFMWSSHLSAYFTESSNGISMGRQGPIQLNWVCSGPTWHRPECYMVSTLEESEEVTQVKKRQHSAWHSGKYAKRSWWGNGNTGGPAEKEDIWAEPLKLRQSAWQKEQRGNSHQALYSMLCGDLNGKEIQKRGHTHTTDSLCCTAVTNTFESNYTQKKRGNSNSRSPY